MPSMSPPPFPLLCKVLVALMISFSVISLKDGLIHKDVERMDVIGSVIDLLRADLACGTEIGHGPPHHCVDEWFVRWQ